MSAEVWSIVATGIVILIAIATSNRSLRREMNQRIDGLSERINAVETSLNERINAVEKSLTERINAVENRLIERLGDVRERLGRSEGLLEGLLATGRERESAKDSKRGTGLQAR